MLQVWPVPVLADNYVWLVAAEGESRAVAVDPGEAAGVQQALAAHGLELAAVLLTHHHADHVAGAAALAGSRLPVFGPALEHVAAVTRPLADGDRLEIAELSFDVLHVPGHTRGHLAYVGEGVLLCGDTLFAAGCGRLFEGSPAEMWSSLRRLAVLPPDTLVCCGHEYTVANLRFARLVEPGNPVIESRLASAAGCRDRGRPTVPSTLADELASNPFLRCAEPTVVAAASRHAGRAVAPGVDCFTVVRRWKDRA